MNKIQVWGAAPLLCAGITTSSPLRQWGVKPGDRVGVVGLGGLGHMAVKLAASMGAAVTVFSTSAGKGADARRLGATDFVVTKGASFKRLARRFDLIVDSVSAPHDYNAYLELLRPHGAMVLIGAPPGPRDRLGHRADPDPEDQRGLRAGGQERRPVSVRDRHGEPARRPGLMVRDG